MVVTISEIPTLRQLYKDNIISHSNPKKKHSGTLLDCISFYQGDITELAVDSIVNAANESLLGGGGIDGAIHSAAGPRLLKECRTLNGCETGQSKITKGHRLPAQHVIHTVGPIYHSSAADECATLLASCYRTSLTLAVQNSLKHIAFCSVSTGIYGYPIEDATYIALKEVRKFFDEGHGNSLERVIFNVWSDVDKEVYQRLIPLYFPLDLEPEPSNEEKLH